MVKISDDHIEGRNPILEALKSGRPINKIYIKKGSRRGSLSEILKEARQRRVPVSEMDGGTFHKLAKTHGHQGVLAAVAPQDYSSVQDILAYARKRQEDPFILVLNELTDPQNLGSIIRTAEGLGAHGIIIPLHRACGITPVVSKVAAGALEYMRVARVTNITQTLDELKDEGLWVMGADAQGKDYFKVDLTGPIALVIGGEDKGLGRLVRDSCDILISIPMMGEISSLNAAVAAAILGYDILRQRLNKNVPTGK